jgi:hypothetical protein
MRTRTVLAIVLSGLLALAACGGDDDDDAGGGGETTTTRSAETTTTARETTTTSGGGTPAFLTFSVSESATCSDGNAEVTMAYTTRDVEDIAISINGGEFQETAGYGPNETDVVANLPCTAGQASEGSVRLRGCGAGNACAESEQKTVQISG